MAELQVARRAGAGRHYKGAPSVLPVEPGPGRDSTLFFEGRQKPSIVDGTCSRSYRLPGSATPARRTKQGDRRSIRRKELGLRHDLLRRVPSLR
jgi:hypothetical protein